MTGLVFVYQPTPSSRRARSELGNQEEGKIDWPALQQSCLPIRQTFEATLQRVVELGYQRGERTPWASTVRTCQQLQKVTEEQDTNMKAERCASMLCQYLTASVGSPNKPVRTDWPLANRYRPALG